MAVNVWRNYDVAEKSVGGATVASVCGATVASVVGVRRAAERWQG